MTEFETYKVKVRVETVGVGIGGTTGNSKSIWTNVRVADDRMKPHLAMPQMVADEAMARANHAVACEDYGLANVWPVSEGELTIETEQGDDTRGHPEPWWDTFVWRPEKHSAFKWYRWPTEAEAVAGHEAVARRYGAK
jgi:hypothetical protein